MDNIFERCPFAWILEMNGQVPETFLVQLYVHIAKDGRPRER